MMVMRTHSGVMSIAQPYDRQGLVEICAPRVTDVRNQCSTWRAVVRFLVSSVSLPAKKRYACDSDRLCASVTQYQESTYMDMRAGGIDYARA